MTNQSVNILELYIFKFTKETLKIWHFINHLFFIFFNFSTYCSLCSFKWCIFLLFKPTSNLKRISTDISCVFSKFPLDIKKMWSYLIFGWKISCFSMYELICSFSSIYVLFIILGKNVTFKPLSSPPIHIIYDTYSKCIRRVAPGPCTGKTSYKKVST